MAGEHPITLELGQTFAQSRTKLKMYLPKDQIDRAIPVDTTRAALLSFPTLPHEIPTIYDLSLGWENVFPTPES